VPHIIGQTGREVVGRRKDGTEFPLELAVSEFHDGKGPGFVGIMHDVTRRKRFEEEDRRHQAELTRVLRVSLVGELGAGLAHEVSQPLGVVVNALETCATRIRAGKTAPREILGLVDQAITESLRAAAIVRNVRDLVRQQPPDLQQIDLREHIVNAARLVAPQLERHQIALRLSLGEAPLPVRGSGVEIEQVMLNLLQNGVDAIAQGDGERPREIAVSALKSRNAKEKSVEVAVHDTGMGVAEDDLTRLFEPFFTTKPAGIGMGLAICRSILEAHGGRMWVAPGENRPGAMTVRFTMPLVSAEASSRRSRPG
jgi:C4-dicarboxylate-specific signal transduction histidine kinase